MNRNFIDKDFFNDNFNFDNRISQPENKTRVEMARELENFECEGGLMLEPRLQEYLNKKNYYRENNINPDVSLEMEFQITKEDIRKIRRLMRGKRDIYDQQKFPLKDKKRKKKLKKMQKDKRVLPIPKLDERKPVNMGMFAPDDNNDDEYFYEVMARKPNRLLDTRDMMEKVNFGLEYELDNQGIDDRTAKKYKRRQKKYKDKRNKYIISNLGPEYMMSKNPHETPKKYYNTNEYVKSHMGLNERHMPNSQPRFEGPEFNLPYPDQRQKQKEWNPYVEYNYMPSEHSFNIAKQRGYNPQYEINEQSEMDFENRMVIPRVKHNSKKNLNNNPVPFMEYGKGISNVEVENELIMGMPSRTFKSYGYRNPEEHYFDFIDNDIQSAQHTVMPFPRGGEATRNNNKSRAKPVSRKIY